MENTTLGNQYQIVRKIATGGMGELFVANQFGEFNYQRQVVIKRLHPELANDALHRGLFIQEAVLSGRFNHPNLVHVHGITEDSNGLYMVMEYIVGMDLMGLVRAAIARRSFLPLEHALCIIAQIGEGLETVHSITDARGRPLNLVHRDVTPSNILITHNGIAKLVDFGVARVRSEGGQPGQDADIIAGKINYMAPEMLSGGAIDHRVDLFGLGVILYELVLGRRLFRGTPEEAREAILSRPIPLPSVVKPGIDPDLEKILLKAVDKNPEYRYQSAGELVLDLEKFAAERKIRFSRLKLARYLQRFNQPDKAVDAAEPEPESGIEDWEGVQLDFDQGFGEGWGQSETQGMNIPENSMPDMDDEEWLELMGSPEKLAQRQRSRPVFAIREGTGAHAASAPTAAAADTAFEFGEGKSLPQPALSGTSVSSSPRSGWGPAAWIALALAVGVAGFMLARVL
ncbi:serine/threonine protein kinase [Myxococcota bacterium]|nr:serine/threonine protein kinase [Myxococcota bacterium]MBU1410797.1 serine/threonine protein kinase [Myxococcota bacterium]MBU1510092.1 serine/threonine protein kinase [Myxococcota bacterium]